MTSIEIGNFMQNWYNSHYSNKIIPIIKFIIGICMVISAGKNLNNKNLLIDENERYKGFKDIKKFDWAWKNDNEESEFGFSEEGFKKSLTDLRYEDEYNNKECDNIKENCYNDDYYFNFNDYLKLNPKEEKKEKKEYISEKNKELQRFDDVNIYNNIKNLSYILLIIGILLMVGPFIYLFFKIENNNNINTQFFKINDEFKTNIIVKIVVFIITVFSITCVSILLDNSIKIKNYYKKSFCKINNFGISIGIKKDHYINTITDVPLEYRSYGVRSDIKCAAYYYYKINELDTSAATTTPATPATLDAKTLFYDSKKCTLGICKNRDECNNFLQNELAKLKENQMDEESCNNKDIIEPDKNKRKFSSYYIIKRLKTNIAIFSGILGIICLIFLRYINDVTNANYALKEIKKRESAVDILTTLGATV